MTAQTNTEKADASQQSRHVPWQDLLTDKQKVELPADLRNTDECRAVWDEAAEHNRDLEHESRETEEREATGYWDEEAE
jgi:predicted anti-sigma-YlaC factor YlaD